MRIVETKGRIAEDGSIVLPSGVLENMRLEAGDSVCLAYLSRHPEKPVNSFGEFFLTENGVGQMAGLVDWAVRGQHFPAVRAAPPSGAAA